MSNASRNDKKRNYPRDPHEWYVEEAWCTEALFEHVSFTPGETVWDPFAGRGTIPMVCQKHGLFTFASDIVRRYDGLDAVHDFFSASQPPGLGYKPSHIIMNPPYGGPQSIGRMKSAERAIRHARGKFSTFLCALVNHDFNTSDFRYDLFNDWPPRLEIVFSTRPSMPPGNRIAEMQAKGTAFKGGRHDYSWFIWSDWPSGKTEKVWYRREK